MEGEAILIRVYTHSVFYLKISSVRPRDLIFVEHYVKIFKDVFMRECDNVQKRPVLI